MNFKSIVSLCLVFLGFSLAACSAKLEGVSPAATPSQPQFADQKATVAGPNLDGKWISKCNAEYSKKTYRQFEIIFAGNTVSRTRKVFTDRDCASTPTLTTKTGFFRFIENYNDGSYQAEYAFDLGSGVTEYPQERISLKNDLLYISNFGAYIIDTEPLAKDSSSSTPTQPNPAPAPPTASCVNYAGSWQINGRYFDIKQTACSEIRWIVLPSYGERNSSETVYTTDGIKREIDGQEIKASFVDSKFNLEYVNQYNEAVRLVFTLEKTPCNLVNPDGSTYLTRRSYVNGQTGSCTFWAPAR